MKTDSELNADILKMTLTIHAKYPELSKFITEMPVTIPDQETPEIIGIHLKNYYDSLVSLVEGYKKEAK